MNSPSPKSGRLFSAVTVLWLGAVCGSYYLYNGGYYVEKVSTFLSFFRRAL
jgi:hypothetical protein